jgi:hypothetical protein
VGRWRPQFREYFRAAVAAAGSPDLVIMATPHTERIADPPTPADLLIQERSVVRQAWRLAMPSVQLDLDAPARDGMFYVLASCKRGRFQGTFLGMLTIEEPQQAPRRMLAASLNLSGMAFSKKAERLVFTVATAKDPKAEWYVVAPNFVRGLVEDGYLVERDGAFYAADEVADTINPGE